MSVTDSNAAFITFEGGEGAGKSTQLRMLRQAFEASVVPCISTREPGGCSSAEAIRGLLVSGETDRWGNETEALLMMAARCEHVNRTIKPALSEGKWVLCDRFFDSTLVYQGQARGLGAQWLWQLYRLCFGQFAPALTFYFDLDPIQGLARTAQRDGSEARFESLPIEFHEKVREGFTALSQQHPSRFVTIDASASLQAIHERVVHEINHRMQLHLQPASGETP